MEAEVEKTQHLLFRSSQMPHVLKGSALQVKEDDYFLFVPYFKTKKLLSHGNSVRKNNTC